MEKLRSAVEACAIPHGRSSTSPAVTISLGVACAKPTQEGPNPETITGEADRCLYLAKRRGLNRVVATEANLAMASVSG